ncbi:MAG: hypothetical protein HYX53_00800 [Chloroflexi bacterium]|nr:hypothetical protein [Chloroflexota bacterium]
MTLRPFVVARLAVYLALAVAIMSVWLGRRAGASFDYTLLRGVFVFIIFAALGFGAEAVLTVGFVPRPAPAPDAHHRDEPRDTDA